MTWRPPHPRRLPTGQEIRDNQYRIWEINTQVDELTTKIDGLVQLRLTLQQEADNRKSFITSFRRLPAEILCAIAWQSWHHAEVSPTILNQVNATMREAVNGFKALWTEIRITTRPLKFRFGVCNHSHY